MKHNLQGTLKNIDCKILEPIGSYLTQALLFGCTLFYSETNTSDFSAWFSVLIIQSILFS